MQLFADVRENSQFSSEKMKKNSLFSTDRFFCDVYCFEAGQRQAAHTHADSDKVYYVLEGIGRFQIGTEERDVPTGMAVLAPATAPHGVANCGPDRLKVLVVMAPPPK